MAELLTKLVLNDYEAKFMSRAVGAMNKCHRLDQKHELYYDMQQKVEQLGIAVPPELRRFETVADWPRVAIDETEQRLDVRTIITPGKKRAAKPLLDGWQHNNLDSRMSQLRKETMIFGRGFATVGTNEDDAAHPIITVESTRQMYAFVDERKRSMIGVIRQYRDWDGTRKRTLYFPDSTIHLVADQRGWMVEDRDDHKLGRPPVILYLNRPRPGRWQGKSELVGVIPITDAVVRTLTNLQVAAEAHSVPTKYALGVSMTDFVDAKTGKPLDSWEAYYTSMMAHSNPKAVIGQLSASDLKNFHGTVDLYGRMMTSVTGLPLRYWGLEATNPASEGAIRADESRLVKNAERKQRDWGDCDAWLMALYERFRTGKDVDANSISIQWHDAGTPTEAQKADAIQKQNGGTAVLSRQGSWDEMGWDQAKKDRETEYFQQESTDPFLTGQLDKEPDGPNADPPAAGQ